MTKILIAEDDVALAKALELKFQHEGFETDHATDGAEAEVKLRAGGADLLILDLVMPKADGFDVLEMMKKEGMKIPVIVASNLSQVEDKDRAMKLGAVDFFIKSDIAISDLVDRVKNIVKP